MLILYKNFANSDDLSTEDKSEYLVNSITKVANNISSINKNLSVTHYSAKNPWFDASCKTAKYKMRNTYRK